MPQMRVVDPESGGTVPFQLRPTAIHDDSEASRLQIALARRYLTCRSEGLDHEVALWTLAAEVEADDAMPAGLDHEVLIVWAREEKWERAWLAIVGADTLEHAELRAENRLARALTYRHYCEDVLERAYKAAVEAQPVTRNGLDGFRIAFAALQAAEAQVSEFEGLLYKRANLETPRPEWREREVEWLTKLREQYGELGPQYEMLIHRAAAAEVRCEELDAAGVTSGEEYARCVDTIVKITAQLQRYTEASKHEAIEARVNASVGDLLDLIQRTVLHDQPQLMRRILDVIKAQAVGDPVPEWEEPERLENGALRSAPIGPFA